MYTPNEHLDIAHQRLRHVTSDEVNAGAPLQYPSAPAASYHGWQHLPQVLSSLPTEQCPAAPHALSPPLEAYGFPSHLNLDSDHPFESWEVPGSSAQLINQRHRRHIPTAPLRENSPQLLLPRDKSLDFAQSGIGHLSYFPQQNLTQRRSVPHGLPLSAGDFLPQTRAYLASSANIINAGSAPIWSIDGFGGGRYQWESHDASNQTNIRHWPAWDYSTDFSSQPQLRNYATKGAPQVQPPIYQFAPPKSVQPRRASSIASPHTTTHNHSQSTQMPFKQEWRTDDLTNRTSKSQTLPDAATRRKQEKFRQKSEARRNTIAAGMSKVQTLAHRPWPAPGAPGIERSASSPAKRRKITPRVAPEARRSSQLQPAPITYQSPYDGRCLQPQMAVYEPRFIELPPPTADELPQAIVRNHEEYKWSVYLYELDPSQDYDFAESWVERLFQLRLQAEYEDRHFSHTTQGFIKDGGRHSIVVLHNAANPFEYEPSPSATVTIGVYGYHWYQHDCIHWTTLASDQRHLFAQCVQLGYLVEKQKWTFVSKAREKRFHRAYWLAANRHDMKGLLNRGASDGKPHDVVDERGERFPDRDFSVSEADLTNEWDVTGAEAAAAWQKVQEEIEALGEGFDACGEGWQHLVIANSEW